MRRNKKAYNMHLDTIGMVKRMRKNSLINEDVERENKITKFDQKKEEERFLDFFRNLNVSIDFVDLEVYDDFVFWGGNVDGVIQFVYKVTPNEVTSGVEFNYLDDFVPEDEDNQEIIDLIESYYDIFYRYWRDNLIQ